MSFPQTLRLRRLIVLCSFLAVLVWPQAAKPAAEDGAAFAAAVAKAKSSSDEGSGQSAQSRPLFESEGIRTGSPAERATVDLNGTRTLFLMATGVGGIGNAHAVWGDPMLVDAEGKKTPLTKLKVKSSKVGWFKLEQDRFEGKPLAVGDQVFTTGIFAHADSFVGYELDKEYAQLIVYIGLNNSSKGGHVKFMVTRDPPAASRVVELESKFPRSVKRLRELFGGNFDKWVSAATVDLEKKYVDGVVKELGARSGELAARAAQAAKETPPSVESWVGLVLAAADRRDAILGATNELAVTRQVIEHFAAEAKRPAFRSELAALEASSASVLQGESGALKSLSEKLAALRRRALFTHPGLQFDDLLFNKRQPAQFSHNSDQYLARHTKANPGLVILKNWKGENPQQVFLTREKLPPGSILHPSLSYDAKRVIFSFADHREPVKERRAFQIWEAALDGSMLRQVTGTNGDARERVDKRQTFIMEDFDPIYLPDGDFLFTSTRGQNVARCHAGRYNPAALLYRGKLDGSGIRPVTFGEANEIDPTVLNDGRIVYNRWEYVNRHDCKFHALWSIFPDGARTANFYKNLTTQPLSVTEARAIPGSDKIMATATAHHSFTAGSILLIDPSKGDEGEDPLTHLTPEVAYPEVQGWPDSTYARPMPIAEDLFFAAYSDLKHVGQGQVQVDNAYRICLVYNLGGKAWREEIVSDPAISCFEPIPLVPREMPPVIPSLVKPGTPAPGTMYVQDVHISTQPLERGSIAWLRLNEIFNQPTPRVPHRSWVMDEVPKAVLGLVKVEADGSAFFKVPSGKAFQIQALDSNFMAVMTMRSFAFSQPGENQTCVGCHEPRTAAPPVLRMPSAKALQELRPLPGPAQKQGFNFVSQVQPVLDRHCIRCHGLDGTAPLGVNLTGEYIEKESGRYPSGKLRMPQSYWSFFSRPGMVKMADRNLETAFSKPKDYFSHTSRLPFMLMQGHNGVRLEADEFQRLVTWLDLNGQLYGNFSWNRRENRVPDKDGEAKLRAKLRTLFGDSIADAPFAALVNNGATGESRALKAPLAAKAGGWEQWTPAFSSTNDAAYAELRDLVEASLAPLPYRDIDGTCGRGAEKCVCGSCWVRELSKR